ncbi:MAG: hypothetical protein KBS85_07695 [Lachnospiraceae bacterium]|nr:hypothetical protein [Candidatus Merdinaster equi]
MFRLWAKIWHENHLIKDMVVENSSDDTRTHKVFQAVEDISVSFDLPKPLWLEKNVNEFKKSAHTRFYQDSFIEDVDFDYLEIQIIEED